jgi:hypothetical protein
MRFNTKVIGGLANKISYQKSPSKAGETTVPHCRRHVSGSRTVSSAGQMMSMRLGSFGNKVRTR